MDREDLRQREPPLVLPLDRPVSRHEEPARRPGFDFAPRCRADVTALQSLQLVLAAAVEIGAQDAPRKARLPHQEEDRGALGHTGEDVSGLMPPVVAVQVEDIDLLEGPQKGPAQAAERRSLEEIVIEDEGDDPFAVVIDQPLREAQELDVVVVQPLRIAFPQALPVNPEVVSDETFDPGSSLTGAAGRVGSLSVRCARRHE